MTKITVHARNLDPQLRMALFAMTEFTLKKLIPSKRLRDNMTLNIHLRHNDNFGEAKVDNDANRYRPRSFRIYLDHHRMVVDDYGREREDTEWAHEILKTLGHELVHVRDYVSGNLSWRDKGLCWKGEHLDPKNMEEYFNLPYEKEAYGMEKGLLVTFLMFWAGIEKEFGL